MSEWFKKRTIGNLPHEAAARWGDREALVFGDRRWSHVEYDAEVDRIAAALIGIGIKQGDKVAIWLTNTPDYLFSFFAIIRIGAIAVPLNTRYRSLDFAYALRDCDASLLITSQFAGPVPLGEMVKETLGDGNMKPDAFAAQGFPMLRGVVFLEGTPCPGATSWDDFIGAGKDVSPSTVSDRAAAVCPDTAAYIIYTSGTTGDAKGVLLGHCSIRLWIDRASQMGLTFADTQLNYLPLFHTYSMAYGAGHSLVSGARQILTETFDPVAALEIVEREKITILHGFDTHFSALLRAMDEREYDLGSVRTATLASGLESTTAIARETQKRICPTIACYGLTESSSGITQCALDATLEQRCEASGYPLPDIQLRVIDPETGADQPVGTEGEILVRGYPLMLGYYNKPDETNKMYDGDGWLHTGDAGEIRADGHLRFLGRYKDMLKVGGENVAPAEIEALLATFPGVAEIAVVGAPDLRLGEIPVAFVVTPQDNFDAKGLVKSCEGRLASFKVPRAVFTLDALPMTPSGKIQKAILREMLKSNSHQLFDLL